MQAYAYPSPVRKRACDDPYPSTSPAVDVHPSYAHTTAPRAGPSTTPTLERPRKRSSLETPAAAGGIRVRGNAADQAWEMYQRLKLNAKAGIRKPDTSIRPASLQSVNWSLPGDGVDKCPAPCHAMTGAGRLYKPNISHLEMIRVVLAGSLDRQLHLEDIYAAVEARWPYYKDNKSNWKASIRHNLSRHECFVSVPDSDALGHRARGGLWYLCDEGGNQRRRSS